MQKKSTYFFREIVAHQGSKGNRVQLALLVTQP